ncbi:membrane-spanning 4-domains subfamily A member 4A-like isoform X1 [Hyperolius riggenbachi]|uniref:membrane-spanning 4-domains subfamily A member 4A-like isoform X1 n=1 Tax=Hyperolius riggenbachi TaxID=752182 RepID=UPI0035A2D389
MSTAKADLRNTDNIPEANTQVIQFGLPDERLMQNVTSDLAKPLQKFHQGEPAALGATQVFSAVLILCLGIVLTILDGYYGREVVYTGVTYWSGILFLICGSVSVSASVKPTLGKVRASLVLNIIASVVASGAIICLSISFVLSANRRGRYEKLQYCVYYEQSHTCEHLFDIKAAINGIMAILLVFTMLFFCITITTAVYGCKTVCRTSFNEINIVLYQTTAASVPEATAEVASVPTAPISSSEG